MDYTHWNKLNQLFHQLVELPQDSREAQIADLSNDDPQLATQLKELLCADQRAGGSLFLEEPAHRFGDMAGTSAAISLPLQLPPFSF